MSNQERELRKTLVARAFLTPAEAAFVIRKDKSTITRWIAKGLKTYKDPRNGTRYVKLSEVHEFKNDPENGTRRRK